MNSSISTGQLWKPYPRNDLSAPEQVLFIHSRLVAETGGSHGMRDLGLLESAVARPRATFDGKEFYPDLFTKTAAPMDSLINNHPFLLINGWKLNASPQDLETITLQVASDGVEVTTLATWLRKNTIGKD